MEVGDVAGAPAGGFARRVFGAWWAFPVALFVVSRAALMVYSWLALAIEPRLYVQGGPRAQWLIRFPALDGLCRWDCGNYLERAELGWNSAVDTVFWPLLPLLIRAVSAVTTLHPQASVLLVSNLAALVTLVVVYRLFFELEGEVAARMGTAAFVAYPYAFFLAGGFAESLMTAFTALAAFLAWRGRHWAGGAALMVGVLARHVSLLAVPMLFLFQAQNGDRLLFERGWARRMLRPALLVLLLPLVSVAIWMEVCRRVTGDPLSFAHARDAWGPGAWQHIGRAFTEKGVLQDRVYLACSLIPLTGAVAALARRRWWPMAGFALPLLAVFFLTGGMSLGRYSSSVWPAYLTIGVWLARHPLAQLPFFYASLMIQGLFFWLLVHQWWMF